MVCLALILPGTPFNLRTESRFIMGNLSKKKKAVVRDMEQIAVAHDVAQ